MMKGGYTSKSSVGIINFRSYLILTILVGLIFLILMGLTIFYSSLNFDEGYNLQIPLNLLTYGDYGSNTLDGGFNHFDSRISTGPVLLLPVTASFAIAGIGVLQARIVSAMFAIILLIGIFQLSKCLGDIKISLVSFILLFFINLSNYTLGTVVGEGAGIGLIIWGLILWSYYEKRNSLIFGLLAALLWGISVWAKPSMVMAVLFIMIGPAIYIYLHRNEFIKVASIILLTLTISTSWFLLFNDIPSTLINEQFNFALIKNVVNNSPALYGSIALGIIVSVILNLISGIRKPRLLPITWVMTNVLPLFWILWWFLFNQGNHYRHLFPGLIFGVIPIALALVEKNHNWQNWVAKLTILALLAFGGIQNLKSVATEVSNTLKYPAAIADPKLDQRQFSNFISTLNPNAKIMGWKGFMDWDIAFLSNRVFGNLNSMVTTTKSSQQYLAITPTMTFYGVEQELSPIIERCAQEVVYNRNGYQLVHLKKLCQLQP